MAVAHGHALDQLSGPQAIVPSAPHAHCECRGSRWAPMTPLLQRNRLFPEVGITEEKPAGHESVWPASDVLPGFPHICLALYPRVQDLTGHSCGQGHLLPTAMTCHCCRQQTDAVSLRSSHSGAQYCWSSWVSLDLNTLLPFCCQLVLVRATGAPARPAPWPLLPP